MFHKQIPFVCCFREGNLSKIGHKPPSRCTHVAANGTGGEAKIREHPLHAGAVFGMTDMMLGLPFRATYTTTSFVHLFFFDRT